MIWRWDGEPFGASLPDEDPDGDGKKVVYNLRFPGQYYDLETGLNYNGMRDYDPGGGRYIEPDPIGLAGGINPYAYVNGNPVSRVDPLGLNPFSGATAGAELGTSILPGYGTIAGAVVGGIGGYLIADKLGNLIFNHGEKVPPVPPPEIPQGWDGATPPADGWTWHGPDAPGGSRGSWVSPDESQRLRPDNNHGQPIGPHTDWKDPNGDWWRLSPDGSCKLK